MYKPRAGMLFHLLLYSQLVGTHELNNRESRFSVQRQTQIRQGGSSLRLVVGAVVPLTDYIPIRLPEVFPILGK